MTEIALSHIPVKVRNNSLFRTSFVYTISNITKNAVPFLLLPVLTRYLSPTDYGIVATLEIMVSIAFALIGLNLGSAVWVNYFKLSKREIKVYITNIFLIQLITFGISVICAFILLKNLIIIKHIPNNWLFLVPIVGLSQSTIAIALALWQVEEKPVQHGLFQILQISLNMGLSIFFIVVLDQKWQGRLLAITIASVLFCLAAFYTVHKRDYTHWSFKMEFIKEALKYGVPLVPHTLSGIFITGIDRFFINYMVSVSATGIYVIGYQVGMIIGLLARSFNQAWSVVLFKKLKENNFLAKVGIVKFTYIYFASIIGIALLWSWLAPYFLNFFVGSDFQAAYKYVFWIALGYAADGMYYMVANYIFYSGKTYIITLITVIAAALNICLNYLLIKKIGPLGAAIATTICFFLSFLLTWIFAAKVVSMPWSFWRFNKIR
jgi:O-antigen/teichoic acid export membrane protein